MTTEKLREWSTEEADAVIAETDMRPRTPHEDDLAILLAELVLDARADLAEAQELLKQERQRYEKDIVERWMPHCTNIDKRIAAARLEGAIEALEFAVPYGDKEWDGQEKIQERLAELRAELEKLNNG